MNTREFSELVNLITENRVQRVNEETVDANFMIALTSPFSNDLKNIRYFKIKDSEKINFIKIWIKTINAFKEKPSDGIFINNIINKNKTGAFKFFLDLDFENLSVNNITTTLIFSFINNVIDFVGSIYSGSEILNVSIWGRDFIKTNKYRFHVHFPDIIVDKNYGQVLVELLVRNYLNNTTFGPLFGRDFSLLEKIFDTAPFSFGIRWEGSRKIFKNDESGEYKTEQDSEYLLYDIYTESLMTEMNAQTLEQEYRFAMIDVNNERTMVTQCDEIEALVHSHSRIQGVKMTERMSNDELLDLSEVINNKLYNGDRVVRFRKKIGRYIVFDANIAHTCPVNPEIVHRRENMYAMIRPDGVYLYCFAECGEPIKIVDYDPSESFTDHLFQVSKLYSLLETQDLPSAIGYTNRFFSVVSESSSSQYYKLTYDPKETTKIQTCKAVSEQSLKMELRCSYKTADNKKAEFSSFWISSSERRNYPGGITYCLPTKASSQTLNLFPGFRLNDEKLYDYYEANRDSEKFRYDANLALNHIRRFWCASEGGTSAFRWMVKWLAYVVQNPFKRPETTPCLVGEEGSGKSGWFRHITKPYFMSNQYSFTNSLTLTTWTTDLANRCLVIYDEAALSDKKIMNSLKSIVTTDKIEINRKYQDIVRRKNTLAIVAITQDVGNITSNSRRFLFLHTKNLFKGSSSNEKKRKQKEKYFEELFDNLDWRNVISFLKYSIKVKRSDVRTLIPTFKTFELKINSEHSPTLKFFLEKASQFRTLETNIGVDKFTTTKMREECAELFKIKDIGLSELRKHINETFPHSISLEESIVVDPNDMSGKTTTKVYYVEIKNRQELIEDLASYYDTNPIFISELVGNIRDENVSTWDILMEMSRG